MRSANGCTTAAMKMVGKTLLQLGGDVKKAIVKFDEDHMAAVKDETTVEIIN